MTLYAGFLILFSMPVVLPTTPLLAKSWSGWLFYSSVLAVVLGWLTIRGEGSDETGIVTSWWGLLFVGMALGALAILGDDREWRFFRRPMLWGFGAMAAGYGLWAVLEATGEMDMP